jgi:hypothetical protein
MVGWSTLATASAPEAGTTLSSAAMMADASMVGPA